MKFKLIWIFLMSHILNQTVYAAANNNGLPSLNNVLNNLNNDFLTGFESGIFLRSTPE